MYKIALLKKEVPVYQAEGIFIPAEDITIDLLTSSGGSQTKVIIAWFDRSKNTALFDYCSTVSFAVIQSYPDPLTFQKDTEDVPDYNSYSADQLTPAQIKYLVDNHSKTIGGSDLIAFPPSGYLSDSIQKPASVTETDSDIMIAVIPFSLLNDSTSLDICAWTIKSSFLATNNNLEIISK